MKRIALGIRYDGSHYHGWQTQETNISTVQHVVEKALSAVANEPIATVCAGRTDAGVHASCQIVHFDTQASRLERSWVLGGNSNLPSDVSFLWAKEVPLDFHARFKARARCYRYVIYNHQIRPGILRHNVGWFYRPLDEKKMQEAANALIGEHDFSAFRGSGCQSKHGVRRVSRITIKRMRRMVVVEIQANAFLMHMVRNIVGLLVEVGSGLKPVAWAAEVLQSQDRCKGGMTFTPNGLYLVDVIYSPEYVLPQTPLGPFFLP